MSFCISPSTRGSCVTMASAMSLPWVAEAGAAPNIPSKRHRKWKACFSKRLYKERNRVERFFNRIKHFRRIATRYEKHAANYLAMLKLAAIQIWLRS
ncbi:MAG TPA: hypothetical protein DCL95_07415 [Rhodospirillaceae bacterium]|nr:hypothetical protein [Rhodospirillales bacterium]MAX64849.1 hypothetical protein [Rhodospirillaceae bacterium]MBB57082.1 hypothetical protein [Rhodospirillaceae bacterium]HAJ19874.1 hypothetical protein [Rhodospirillaceae bacterium]